MVLNYGSLNADIVFQVPHFVQAGETLASEGVSIQAGGKGANQSVALARAGIAVQHAGKVGRDGGWMRDHLEKEGVGVRHLSLDGAQLSGQALIQVTPEGENSIILAAGTNGTISHKEIDGVLADFGPDDILLAQNEISGMPYLIEAGRRRGMSVVLNAAPCGPAVALWPLSLVHLLVVNETEGFQLTGETAPARILDIAASRWPDTALLLTLGKDGAWFSTHGVRQHQASLPAQVVDTTAAGDTFLAFFLAAWKAGRPSAEALLRASAAASITVSRRGACESIPTAREVDERLRVGFPR